MIIDDIRNTLSTALPDATIMVNDPMNDETHFEAIVISPSFEGLTLVKQHQLVMRPLTQAFANNLHALALKTYTPTQWEAL